MVCRPDVSVDYPKPIDPQEWPLPVPQLPSIPRASFPFAVLALRQFQRRSLFRSTHAIPSHCDRMTSSLDSFRLGHLFIAGFGAESGEFDLIHNWYGTRDCLFAQASIDNSTRKRVRSSIWNSPSL